MAPCPRAAAPRGHARIRDLSDRDTPTALCPPYGQPACSFDHQSDRAGPHLRLGTRPPADCSARRQALYSHAWLGEQQVSVARRSESAAWDGRVLELDGAHQRLDQGITMMRREPM